MAGTDPAAPSPGPAGDLPRDPASAEANAATIDHLRTLLADHAAGRVHSDLWSEGDQDLPGQVPPAGDPGEGRGRTPHARVAGPPAGPGEGRPQTREHPTGDSGPGELGEAVEAAGLAGAAGRDGDGRVAEPTEPVAAGSATGGLGADPDDPDDPYERGREIALRQLSFSARSRHQLATAMLEREIPEPVVTDILDRFEQVGLVDDAEYAAMLVRTRHQERGLARPALAEELRRKGITGPIAEAALDQVDVDDERAAARDLVERRLRSMGPVEPAKRRQRLYSMLARRGYGTAVAVSVVDEALAAQGLSRY